MTRHLLVAVALVGLTLAGGVHYDAAEERHLPYPTEDRLSDGFEQHVGSQALLFGTVRSVDPAMETATIEVESGDGSFTVEVRGFDADVEPGGTVQVFGTLQADRGLTASNVVVVERGGHERLWKYGTSVLGAVLALVAFFKYWRIDLATMTFEPR